MDSRRLGRSGLKAPVLTFGARNEAQLRDNLGAVGWNLTAQQVAKLEDASAVTMTSPYRHQRLFVERNPFPAR